MSADTLSFGLFDDSDSLIRTFHLQYSKFDATAAPGTGDDDADGFIAGSLWVDRTNHKVYVCQDNTTGAAVWAEIPGTSGGSDLTYNAENKAGVAIKAGMACAVHSSGVGVVMACAADASANAVGLMQVDTANTFAGDVQTEGLFTLADWTDVIGATTLAAKTTYFLDPSTPGMLTATPPTTAGQVIQIVGTAVSDDTLDLTFETPILL